MNPPHPGTGVCWLIGRRPAQRPPAGADRPLESGNDAVRGTGDAANELSAIVLDPNVHIQEVKALTADIRPGRRPRGPQLLGLLNAYRQRAGVTERTGMEVRG